MDLYVHRNEILYNNNLFLQIKNESKRKDQAVVIHVEKS